MKKFGIYPKLTKSYILERVSQEEIMEKFLGIPVDRKSLTPNSLHSPYRKDENPSCNYWYNENDKLRFKDWAYNINYDCFDVVAKEIQADVKHKQGFIFVLHAIAKEFRLHIYEDSRKFREFEKKVQQHKQKRSKIANQIRYHVEVRQPNYHDVAYWKRYHLDINDLKGVYFIQRILASYQGKQFTVVYAYDPKDVCYGYYGKKDKDTNIDLWKFYFPLRKKGDDRGARFLGNGSFMQGIQYLQPDKLCIITKAYKDALVFRKLGIQSCGLSSETTPPSDDEIWYLKTNFDFIVTCFDWDRTGCVMAKKLRKEHNFYPIMFTRGYFNTPDFGHKDSSDFVEAKDLFTLKTIINKEYSKHKDELNNYLKNLNAKLNFI